MAGLQANALHDPRPCARLGLCTALHPAPTARPAVAVQTLPPSLLAQAHGAPTALLIAPLDAGQCSRRSQPTSGARAHTGPVRAWHSLPHSHLHLATTQCVCLLSCLVRQPRLPAAGTRPLTSSEGPQECMTYKCTLDEQSAALPHGCSATLQPLSSSCVCAVGQVPGERMVHRAGGREPSSMPKVGFHVPVFRQCTQPRPAKSRATAGRTSDGAGLQTGST
jgi:hypothetical protein